MSSDTLVTMATQQTNEAIAKCENRIKTNKDSSKKIIDNIIKEREEVKKELQKATKRADVINKEIKVQSRKTTDSEAFFTSELNSKQLMIQKLTNEIAVQKPIIDSVSDTNTQIVTCTKDVTFLKQDMNNKRNEFSALLKQEKLAKQEAVESLNTDFKLKYDNMTATASREIQEKMTIIATINQQKNTMEDTVKSNEKMMKELRSNINLRETEFQNLTTKMNIDLTGHRAVNVNLTNKFSTLEALLTVMSKEYTDLENANTQDKANAKKAGDDAASVIDGRDKTIGNLQKDLTTLKTSSEDELVKCRSLHDSGIAILTSKHTKYISDTNKLISDKDKKVKNLTTDKKDLEDQITRKTKQCLDKKNAETKEFEKLISVQSKKMMTVQDELARMRVKYTAEQDKIGKLGTQINDLTTKNLVLIEGMKASDAEGKREMESLQQRLTFCDTKGNELNTKLSVSEQRVFTLSDQIAETNRSLLTCTTELNHTTTISKESTDTITNLHNTIKDLTQKLDGSNSTVKSQFLALSLVTNNLNAEKNRIDTVNKLRDQTIMEVTKLRGEATRHERELSELRNKIKDAADEKNTSSSNTKRLEKMLDDMHVKNSKCMAGSEQCSISVEKMTEQSKIHIGRISQLETNMKNVELSIRKRDTQHMNDLDEINSNNQSHMTFMQKQHNTDINNHIKESVIERNQHNNIVQNISQRNMDNMTDLIKKINDIESEMNSLVREMSAMDRTRMTTSERAAIDLTYKNRQNDIKTRLLNITPVVT